MYPRKVVKDALRLTSSAVVLVHSHPSGPAEPSAADRPGRSNRVASADLRDVGGDMTQAVA